MGGVGGMPSVVEDLLKVTKGSFVGPASCLQSPVWNLTAPRAFHLGVDDRSVLWESQVRTRRKM